MAPQLQEAGVRYGIENQTEVERAINGLKQRASRVNRIIERAEQKLKRGKLAQLGIQSGRSFVTGGFSFLASEFLADAVTDQFGSRAGGIVAGIAGPTAAVIALGGGPAVAISVAVGAVVSQIWTVIRGVQADAEAEKRKNEDRDKRVIDAGRRLVAQREADRENLRLELAKLRQDIDQDALNILHKTWNYQ